MGGSPGICNWMVNQQLLLQNEYLIAENRILRKRTCPLGCVCQTPGDPRLLKSASDWAVKL